LAFRLGSRFCRHGFLPGAHCIWNVFVRSLPNKKVSQQAKRLSSTIDRRQASTAGEPTISPSAMKIWAEAEGIARSNRERPSSQQAANAGLVAETGVAELALEIGFLAGDHAVTDDEIKQHQRHEDPQTVEGDREADQAKDHAEINRVAREAVRSVRDD